jgi:tetratricopeptide (TPR) repeat protein
MPGSRFSEVLAVGARKHAFSAVALFALIALGVSVRPAAAEQGTEVSVTILDEAKNPLVGLNVELRAVDKEDKPLGTRAPMTKETNKKGVAFFYQIPYNAQGEGRWAIKVVKDGSYIREFKIESRQRQSTADRGAGTVIQDDSGKLTPRIQDKLPPLRAKPSGTALISLEIVPLPAGAQTGGAAPSAGTTTVSADPLMAAKLLAQDGKYDEAEAAIKALAEKDPQAKYDFELARVYHAQSKGPEEEAALESTIAKDPGFRDANYMLGRADYQNGNIPQALSHFEKELAAHPDSSVAQAAIGGIYSEQGKMKEALGAFEAILAREPTNADAMVALGGLYAKQGDVKKSEETYKKVVDLDPSRADQIYYKVGQTIADQKDLTDTERQRAVEAFTKAVELNPKNDKAQRALGYALIGLGRLEDAKPHFKAYLDLKPTAPDASTIRSFLKGS